MVAVSAAVAERPAKSTAGAEEAAGRSTPPLIPPSLPTEDRKKKSSKSKSKSKSKNKEKSKKKEKSKSKSKKKSKSKDK